MAPPFTVAASVVVVVEVTVTLAAGVEVLGSLVVSPPYTAGDGVNADRQRGEGQLGRSGSESRGSQRSDAVVEEGVTCRLPSRA